MRVEASSVHASQPRRGMFSLRGMVRCGPAFSWLLAGCLATAHEDSTDAGVATNLAATQRDDSGAEVSPDVPPNRAAEGCSTDDDCDGIAARCERSAGLCLMRCPNVVLATQADLRAARACHEIDGDLVIRSTDLERVNLPYLERVSGSILSAGGSPLAELTLPALREAGTPGAQDIIELGFDANALRSISLPELRVVHGDLGIVAAEALTELHLPVLKVVEGAFGLIGLPHLTKLELNAELQTGRLAAFQELCSLPFSTLPNPSGITTEELSLQDLGCCTASSFACQSWLCQCGI
jgi:hypothetical protein